MMADNTRSDRQLMRQRGAGLRNVNKADFGLNFQIHDSREDRRLMRQRGAGNRDIKDVDFGFSIPTPNQSRRSSRTPNTIRSRGNRSSNTPTARSIRQSSAARSVRAQSADNTHMTNQQRSSQTPRPNIRAEQPNSSKRRRLRKEDLDVDPKVLGASTQHERHQNTPNIRNTIAELHEPELAIEDLQIPVRDQTPRSLSAAIQPSSPLFFPDHEDKENDGYHSPKLNLSENPASNISMSGRLQIEDQPFVDTISEDPVIQSIEHTATEDLILTAEDNTQVDAADLELTQRSVSNSVIDLPRSTSTASENPTKKRKRRKLVVQGRKRRRSSQPSMIQSEEEPTTSQSTLYSEAEGDVESVGESSVLNLEPELQMRTKNPPLWKRLALQRTQKRQGRMSISSSPAPADRTDEEGDGTYVDEDASPEPITPAPKQKKITDRKQGSRIPAASRPRINSKLNSFPIVTHRIANVGALPTIIEEEHEDNSDGDTQPIPSTFSNRAQANPVEVLAQYCRETVLAIVDYFESESKSSASRAEIKRKRTVLETFGDSLNQHLLEMSQAVEHRITLEARLKKSKREKTELQARWMEVRRQRDELALKADIIRRQNWDDEEEVKQQWETSELAHGIQLDLERAGSDEDEDNLEFMLKQVAGNVSSCVGQGGILDRVKSFNKQLETLALSLEGR